MAGNFYHLTSRWRVPGTIEEVAAILIDAPALVRWWPAVYLDVRELARGDAGGVGAAYAAVTRGWLLFTLRWQCRIVESRLPNGLTLEVWGDLVGRGAWTLVQDGPWADIVFHWRVRAEKPWVRRLSFLFRRVFVASHDRAMRKGEASLRLELARRRAQAAAALEAAIAPPNRRT